jgi:hypothetical protein
MMKTHLISEPAGKALDIATLVGTTGGIALLLSGVFFPGAQMLPMLGLALLFPSLMYGLR